MIRLSSVSPSSLPKRECAQPTMHAVICRLLGRSVRHPRHDSRPDTRWTLRRADVKPEPTVVPSAVGFLLIDQSIKNNVPPERSDNAEDRNGTAAPQGADRRDDLGDRRARLARRDHVGNRRARRRFLGARASLFRRQGRTAAGDDAPSAGRTRSRHAHARCAAHDAARARVSAVIAVNFSDKQFQPETIAAWLAFYVEAQKIAGIAPAAYASMRGACIPT